MISKLAGWKSACSFRRVFNKLIHEYFRSVVLNTEKNKKSVMN